MEYTTNSNAFRLKMKNLLMKAPPQFLNAFQSLSSNNLMEAAAIFAFTIPQLRTIDRSWEAAACCCYAFCMKETGDYEEAIKNAKQGKKLGLNLVGLWYYHEVMDHSLNYLDDLQSALEASNEAIQFFSKEKSIGDEVNHLSRKANILKQMAAFRSRDSDKINEAKDLIIDAIYSICRSIHLIPDDWEEICGDLDAISKIAKRVGVTRDELTFLDSMENIKIINDKYFDAL